MGKVYTGASISLDGYIASPADPGFEHLFGWRSPGDVAVPTADPQMTMPVVVLAHSVPDGWPRDDAPFHVVHDGIEAAVEIARQLAGPIAATPDSDVTHLRCRVRT